MTSKKLGLMRGELFHGVYAVLFVYLCLSSDNHYLHGWYLLVIVKMCYKRKLSWQSDSDGTESVHT